LSSNQLPVAGGQSADHQSPVAGGPSADLLATIVAATERIVEDRAVRESPSALEKRALETPLAAGRFISALRRPTGFNVIAECKRRSPSRGVLRHAYDPVAIAASYAAAGAAAISVLTEPTFFDGSLDHLVAVRRAVEVPLLRKDFIVTEYQLFEARACGADAVLLIVAALPQPDLRRLCAAARALDLDVLVEVHDAAELDRALEIDATVIGVNNRNLRTLAVDVRASESLVARIPRGVIGVSESGLRSVDDLRRLSSLGYRAFLVGERFMTADDPCAALKELLCS
jgi:indole-3-glycerol phosphate synthase